MVKTTNSIKTHLGIKKIVNYHRKPSTTLVWCAFSNSCVALITLNNVFFRLLGISPYGLWLCFTTMSKFAHVYKVPALNWVLHYCTVPFTAICVQVVLCFGFILSLKLLQFVQCARYITTRTQGVLRNFQ